MALRPVNSEKHENTWSLIGSDLSGSTSIRLAIGTVSADKNAADEVEVGSHIKSVYFEFNVSAKVITNEKVFHWTVHLRPQNLTAAGVTPTLYYQSGRNLILKRGMEMLPKDAGTVYKRIFVVRIPPKWQRFGEGDVLTISFQATSAETMNFCGFTIYKEIK